MSPIPSFSTLFIYFLKQKKKWKEFRRTRKYFSFMHFENLKKKTEKIIKFNGLFFWEICAKITSIVAPVSKHEKWKIKTQKILTAVFTLLFLPFRISFDCN